MRSITLFAALAGLLVAGVGAETPDPLATEALLPAGPPARGGVRPCASALPEHPLAVVDAVDLALCNNPLTREAWANARAQAAQVGVVRSAWLPSLNGEVGVGRARSNDTEADQRRTTLNFSWLLFDFGTRTANIEGARQLLAAFAATRDATVQQVFLAALQSYYGAQAARAAVDAAREAERASFESYQAADTRYQVGVATPADRLQAQTAWSQATLSRIRAEGEARNSLGILANALGFDAHHSLTLAELPVRVPDGEFQRDVSSLIDEARRRRPDLRAAEAQVEAARAGIDSARAAGLPTFSLAAVPTWQELGGRSSRSGTIGVTMSLPLFTGFASTYRLRVAEAQAEARGAQRDRVRNQVALDVWQSYQSLLTATQALKTTADLVTSAEASERVALGRYKAGVGSILDVLNAQSALASARQQRIQAGLDWNVFRATLAQAMGSLDYSLLEPPAEGKQ